MLKYMAGTTVTPANSLRSFVSGMFFQSFHKLSKGSQSRLGSSGSLTVCRVALGRKCNFKQTMPFQWRRVPKE